jgi:phage baseplate assembly protein W
MTYDPIGHGLLTPFRRDGKGDFAHAAGLPALASDVRELLTIVGPTASTPGELPWDTERGTRLTTLPHRPLHGALVRAEADMIASGALRLFEPRVRPGATHVTVEGADTLRIAVTYQVLGTNAGPQTVDVATQGRR